MKNQVPRERKSSFVNFKPGYEINKSEESLCRWSCIAMQKILSGDWHQRNWMGKKDCCGSHTHYGWSLSKKKNIDLEVSISGKLIEETLVAKL
jgi:hypothetical protein